MSRFAKQFLTWTLGTIGAMGLSYFLFQWMQLTPFVPASTQSIPDIELGQASLMHYDGDGNRIWTVDAVNLAFDEDNQRTVATEVEVHFWSTTENVGEEPQLIVITPQLNFTHLDKNLTFENGLEARSSQGLKFRTDTATWSDRDQVLEGKGNVRLEQGDVFDGTAVLEGDTIRYDTRTGEFVVSVDADSEDAVNLRVEPDEEESP